MSKRFAALKFDKNMRFIGDNKRGHEIIFDTSVGDGGDNTAASPMEVMLQSVAACSAMDVVSIIRKKRKIIDSFKIEMEAEKTEEHPKVYSKLHLQYILNSPDCKQKDLDRAIELSQEKYCGASAMYRMAGVEITWEGVLINN